MARIRARPERACRSAPAVPFLRNLPGQRLLLINSLNSGLVFSVAGSPEGPPEFALKETFRRIRNAEQLNELVQIPSTPATVLRRGVAGMTVLLAATPTAEPHVVLESDSL